MKLSEKLICAKCGDDAWNENWEQITSTQVICLNCKNLFASQLEQLKQNFIESPVFPKIDKIENGTALILEGLGLREKKHDKQKHHLEGTAKRMAKGLVELCEGLFMPEPKITVFDNLEGYDQLVLVNDIKFVSLCSHHFLPFEGTASFGYIPGEHIIGLSKLARIFQYFSRRPQVQEVLTEQVADFLMTKINPRGVIVVVKARHSCMAYRGVKADASMTTSALRGIFKTDASAKEEALLLMKV